jgi:hypothetical protein
VRTVGSNDLENIDFSNNFMPRYLFLLALVQLGTFGTTGVRKIMMILQNTTTLNVSLLQLPQRG